MRINFLQGRLGKHRFHSMLVHFPSALYPFGFVMDMVGFFNKDQIFINAGWYALIGAISMSSMAIIYGTIDFLQIEPNTNVWRKAGLHAILNVAWLMIFSILMIYRLKHPSETLSVAYLTIEGLAVLGLFYSNYLGADLIIQHKVGIQNRDK